MSDWSWRDSADRHLARLFVPGQPALTREQVRDAYPFGERAMWPYKVWLKRVKAWQHAHALGLARPAPTHRTPAQRNAEHDVETLPLF